MSAKSKRDALLSQLTSSLTAQAPAEMPQAVETRSEPEQQEITATDAGQEAVASAPEEEAKVGKSEAAKPPRKKSRKSAPSIEVESVSSNVGPSSTGSGKQTSLWLDDEDRSILHEMGMQLYTQGIKPSHNLVVRVALRMLPKDHRFFEKAKELIEQDGRTLRHR